MSPPVVVFSLGSNQADSSSCLFVFTPRSVVDPHLSDLILTTTDAREQRFYYKLYQTGRADRVQNMIADFLIDLKVGPSSHVKALTTAAAHYSP